MLRPIPKRTARTQPARYEGDDLGFNMESAEAAVATPAGTTMLRERLSGSSWVGLSAATMARRWFVPAARICVFVAYFWFGLLELVNLSPATPLASALVSHTIGPQYFAVSFKALAVYECALGVLFLIPALTRVSVVLQAIHLVVVTSPLMLVAQDAWTHPLVPTFEGQYIIITDLALIALAIGILAHTPGSGTRARTDS